MTTNQPGQSVGPHLFLGALSGLLGGVLLGWLTQDLRLIPLGIMFGAGFGLASELLMNPGRDS